MGMYERRRPVREWLAWLASDAAPAMVSGLFIIALASGAIGYLIAVLVLALVDRAEMAAARARRPIDRIGRAAIIAAMTSLEQAIGGPVRARRDYSGLVFGAAALASAGLLLWAAGDPLFAGAFLAGLLATGGLLYLLRRRPRRCRRRLAAGDRGSGAAPRRARRAPARPRRWR